MKKNIIFNIIILCTLSTSLALNISAQSHPVSATLNIAPPTSVYLSDFTTPGSQRLNLMINQQDENEPFLDVAINLRISGNGVLLQSDPNFPYAPITLVPGSNVLIGSDLDQYFNPANMVISGIDPQELLEGKGLPEGMYTFCLEITDYLRRDKKLSQESCTISTLLTNNPVQTVFPQCNSSVPYTGIQNVQFSWQANHDFSIASEYTVRIAEVPPNINPNDAINGAGTPILEDYKTSMNNFLYDNTFVDLEVGKTYAYRIDVSDTEGLTTFENEGIGEVCWFTYGSEGGGVINLSQPADGATINTSGTINLAWSGPSNAIPTDQINYRIKVVEIEPGQSAQEAMGVNPLVVDETTGIVSQNISWNYAIDDYLEREKNYGWQIESYIGDQLTATSDVWTLVSAPFINSFVAADKTIKVTTTNGGYDASNLSGSGFVKLSTDGPDIPITFSDINVGMYPAGNYMEGGSIVSALEDYNLIYDNGDNGALRFEASDVIIEPSEFKLRGRMAWEIPQPTIDGNMPIAYTETLDLDYKDYQLRGTFKLEEKSLTLLDPIGIKVLIDNTSTIDVSEDNTKVNLNGKVTFPTSVKNDEGNPVSFDFINHAQLYNIIINDVSDGEKIKLFKDANIYLQPVDIHIDLDEMAGVDAMGFAESWKGSYFPRYNIVMDAAVDKGKQLNHKESLVHAYDNGADEDHYAWIDNNGLQLKVDKTITSDHPVIAFNTFPGEMTGYDFHFSDGALETGNYIGNIYIHILGDDPYEFQLPISIDGFMTGYLTASLDGSVINSSDGSDINELELTIKNASFSGNNHLLCGANFNWVNLDCQGAKGSGFDVPNFRIWGNGNIGFDKPNERRVLQNKGKAKLDGVYSINVDSIYAGLGESGYLYTMIGDISLGSQVSGGKGAPKFRAMASSKKTTHSTDKEVAPSMDTLKEESTALAKGQFIKEVQIPSINITIPGLFKVENKAMKYSQADTLWGHCFKGSVQVDVYKPKQFGVNANVVTGVYKDRGYFFLELSAGGTSLEGIPDSLKQYYENTDGSVGNQNPGITLGLGPVEIHKIVAKFYLNVMHQEKMVNGKPKFAFYPTEEFAIGGFLGVSLRDVNPAGKNGEVLDLNFGGYGIGSSSNFNFGIDLALKLFKEYNVGGSLTYCDNPTTVVGNAFFKMKKPICVSVNAGTNLNFDTKTYKFNLGTKLDKILVIPSADCIGIGGNGWIGLDVYAGIDDDPDVDSIEANLGLGIIAQVEKETKWYEIGLEDVWEVDVQGKLTGGINLGIQGALRADIDPEFKIDVTKIGGWLDAWLGLDLNVNTNDGLQTYNLGSVVVKADFLANLDPDNNKPSYWDANANVTASIFDMSFTLGVKFKEQPFE